MTIHTQLEFGQKVTGQYFGIDFVGIVESDKNHPFYGHHYTVIRCEPPINMDYGLNSIRELIGIYDYQLELPSLGCSIEVVPESTEQHAR